MPTDRRALDARLAAATPSDTVRGLVFNAIFHVAREHGGPDVPNACDPEGKGQRVDFFAYPVADFLRVLWAVGDALEKKLHFDEVLRRMGHRTARTVLSSLVGRTLTAMAGMDARQLVSQTPTAYRTTVSFGQRKVEWLDDRHARVLFTRDFLPPPLHCGVFVGALESIGAGSPKATGQETAPLQTVFDVTWE
jgi:uncharacterized protein (TIGR02265 family)